MRAAIFRFKKLKIKKQYTILPTILRKLLSFFSKLWYLRKRYLCFSK